MLESSKYCLSFKASYISLVILWCYIFNVAIKDTQTRLIMAIVAVCIQQALFVNLCM